MGSALAQKFAQERFNVVLADREMQYVEKGINGIRETLQQEAAIERIQKLSGHTDIKLTLVYACVRTDNLH